ncbi:MAG TPA: FtsX-like permease family protein [Stellaceae bacterium]|nr:FtsX-like permease family protein [Stellaceae bacterium]
MKVPLAWHILVHEKGRTALALLGIFMAVVLVFTELGFFLAVPRGGLLLYDNLRFDLMLVSNQYEYQVQPGVLPRRDIDRLRRAPEVAAIAPLYFADAKWQAGDGIWPDTFVIGLPIGPPRGMTIFTKDEIDRALGVLARPDTILVDQQTRAMFGPLRTGREIRLNGHRETIGGTYRMGTGFMGLGVALISEENFARLFPRRGLAFANLGLIRLKPGVEPARAAADLEKRLGDATRIFTRNALEAHEVAYWTTRTSVGIIFGSGLVIAIVVGIMTIYQSLASQISRQLPQFATLKAIGYRNRTLSATVLAMALLLLLAAFVPAFLAAVGLYSVIRQETLLPVAMTGTRLAAVFAASLVMAAVSALLSIAGLRRAAPADVF